MQIKFKKLHPDAKLPQKATVNAGGWDVTCTEIIEQIDGSVVCKLGWAAEIPVGYRLILVPRSSFTKYKWLLQNSPGLGDADFRGEYSYVFRPIPDNITSNSEIGKERDYNYEYFVVTTDSYMGYSDFPYKVGDRIGQVYIEQVIEIEPEWSDVLSKTDRNDGGFGSTGK